MKPRFRLRVSLCCLGSLLLGPVALAQDPRAVVVDPAAPVKARDLRASRAPARRPLPAVAKRYWADRAGKAIRRSNLDGSQVETLATSVEDPYGVTYDDSTGYVLWTSAGDEVVQTAPANGTGDTLTLNSSFEDSFGIVLPGSESNVAYGVEAGQVIKVTENRSTGATTREVLLTLSNPDAVHGLALSPDQTALYLGDEAGRMIQKLYIDTRQTAALVYDNSAPILYGTPEPQPSTASQPAPSSMEKTR